MKKILFLICIEDPLTYPIIQNMVLRLQAKIARECITKKIRVVSIMPLRQCIAFRKPISSLLSFRQRTLELQKKLIKDKVEFQSYIYPFGHCSVCLTAPHLFLFIVQTLPILFFEILKYRPHLIHSRSYPASLISYLIKKINGTSYIFDMRGKMPEEGVYHKRWGISSFNYKMWKWIEKKIIIEANNVIVESELFKKYVEKQICSLTTISIIPPNVDTTLFKFDNDLREQMRNKYKLESKFVVTYNGSIGGWHDPKLMVKCFSILLQLKTNAHFLLISQSPTKEVLNIFKNNILNDKFTVISAEPNKVYQYLLMGDVGLLLIKKNAKKETAISVKFGEYLACGLPIIVNNEIKAAADLVNEHQCGIVVNMEDDINIIKNLKRLTDHYNVMRTNGFDLVNNYLSIDVCKNILLNIYSII